METEVCLRSLCCCCFICLGLSFPCGVTDPAHSANCLIVSHCAHCSLNPWKARCTLRGWKKTQSPRNCGRIYSLLPGAAASSCRHTVIQHSHTQPSRTFPGEAYIYLPNRSSLWPSKYLLRCMHRAICDLSCCIIIIHKTWGKSRGASGSRELDHRHLS